MTKNIQAMMQERTVHYKEAIVSFFLGLPDGITYYFYGLAAGYGLAKYLLHLDPSSFLFIVVKYLIGCGAALGVAFFAINNVSREYGNVFKRKPAAGAGPPGNGGKKNRTKRLKELSGRKISKKSSLYVQIHFELGTLYHLKEKWDSALRHYRFAAKASAPKEFKKIQSVAEENAKEIADYLKSIEAAQG